jgi:predicted AAA+ superfamily ATPase
MIYYKRYLQIKLPARQSAFLWGARKTGKSTFLKKSFPQAIYYDLLKSDIYLSLSRTPHLLREELLATDNLQNLVIIDEVEKIPALLDEIHWLIENTSLQFILCGSSARKLKRHGVNLLGGRAWKYHFFPLAYPELPEFDLLKIFRRGTVPAHYDSPAPNKALKAYLEDYITMEIQAEGLVRNLSAFARFMDAIRFSHGEMINYSNIAREAHVDSKTVRSYFSILVDTLLAYLIYPYKKQMNRQIIAETPKFYLFDVGVANYLQRQNISETKGQSAGRALEHYILLELIAYKELNEKDFEINYWRTKTGLEVDFILASGKVAIEVKIGQQPDKNDLKGLIAFQQEHHAPHAYLVCLASRARRIKYDDITIDILPIKTFLEHLWQHKIA